MYLLSINTFNIILNHTIHGGVAQLGERIVRNDEAEGSNPFTSTK